MNLWPIAIVLIILTVFISAILVFRIWRGELKQGLDAGNKQVVIIALVLGAIIVGLGVWFMRDIISIAAEVLPLDQSEQEAIGGFLHSISIALQVSIIALYIIFLTQAVTRLLQPEPPDVGKAVREAVEITLEKTLPEIFQYLERRDTELFRLMRE